MSLQQQEIHEYEDIENYNATPTTTTSPAAGPVVLSQQSSTEFVPDINLTPCLAYNMVTIAEGQRSRGIEEMNDEIEKDTEDEF